MSKRNTQERERKLYADFNKSQRKQKLAKQLKKEYKNLIAYYC